MKKINKGKLLLKIYEMFSIVSLPFIAALMAMRKQKGKEDISRFSERVGLNRMPRPEGKLLWMHGASVGETLSMLPLINKVLENYPTARIMVTSGTTTSAKLMAERLPDRAFHQYIPIDNKKYAKRFVEHFKPDAAIWFESDLWPNLLTAAHDAGVSLVLANGRISDRSFKRWSRAKEFVEIMQGYFSVVLGQSELDAERLAKLGAKNAVSLGNLKFASDKPPVDAKAASWLKEHIGSRKVFLAASTHNDEELRIAKLHKTLTEKYPDLLTVILLRHPGRGLDVVKQVKRLGIETALRSKAERITSKTGIYVADTIGETGTFFDVADIVFVGGSLIPFGGQNMIEPARFKKAVIVGPHTHNFKEVMRRALDMGAILAVKDEDELRRQVDVLLSDPEAYQALSSRALEFAEGEAGVIDRVFLHIKPLLDGRLC